MRLLLIRHGETDWNKEKRIQGREDIPLNETGILQAINCGKGLQGGKFAAIISSPLDRARKTAEIIGEAVDINKLIIDDDLIERDFDRISGMTYKERREFDASGQIDNRETREALSERMIRSILKHGKEFYDKDIIFVSHGAAIRSVIDEYTDGELTRNKIILKNAYISILYYDEKSIRMGPYNLSGEEYREKMELDNR
ncbi:MAG: histidine phosphatase family protein [Clostridiales bacterium]|nr:histidine phosphatase family protein [Clostridiales bacterium]